MWASLFSLNVSLIADVAVKNNELRADAHTPAAAVQVATEGGHDKMTDEELCSTSAVLGNITEKLSQEFLEMLVENILRDPDAPSAPQAHTLEVMPVISSAVVTFQSEKGTPLACVCVQGGVSGMVGWD